MKSELHSSYRSIEFTKDLLQKITLHAIKNIDYFISQNDDKIQIRNYIKVIESELLEKIPTETKFKYHKINYGFSYHESFKIPKNLYLIDLYDIVQSYLSNPSLKSMLDLNYESKNPELLTSFFDGKFYRKNRVENQKILFLAIYADEITLDNPIGNFLLHVIV